ncbi:hypothetical protein VPH35_033449 [Triticum aestivum]
MEYICTHSYDMNVNVKKQKRITNLGVLCVKEESWCERKPLPLPISVVILVREPSSSSWWRERETKKKKGMAMAPPRLLRGLIAPLPLLPADWLPCHQQLLASAALLHRWWIPSLARLRCSDGFKLFLVLLLVSAALAEVRYVASASMAPTLRPGDRAVAEKVSYRFRRPSVGDIVFFRVPTALQNCGMNKDVVFIKRVIATPGDFIEVRQGQLIVNSVAQNEHYTAPHASSYTMEAMVWSLHLFLLPC